MSERTRRINSTDVAEITLMSPGDIILLYSDGVYDGSDEEDRRRIEEVVRAHKSQSAKDICNAIVEDAVRQDDRLRQNGEEDRIDDKTAFVIKRA